MSNEGLGMYFGTFTKMLEIIERSYHKTEQELSRLLRDKKLAKDKIDAAQQTEESTSDEITRLQERIRELERTESSGDKIRELESVLKQLTAERDTTKKKIEEEKRKVASGEEEIKRLAQSLKEVTGKHKELYNSFMKYGIKTGDLESELERKSGVLDIMMSKNEELQGEVERIHKEREDKESELKRLQEQKDRQIKEQQEEMGQFIIDLEKAKRRARKCHDELERLKESRTPDTDEKVITAERELAEAIAKVKALTAEREDCNTRIQAEVKRQEDKATKRIDQFSKRKQAEIDHYKKMYLEKMGANPPSPPDSERTLRGKTGGWSVGPVRGRPPKDPTARTARKTRSKKKRSRSRRVGKRLSKNRTRRKNRRSS